MENDKMTIERVVKEYGMGKETVSKLFKDKELPVQTYTRPQFVLRRDLEKYFSVRHDYLAE